ncbi:MAG TPA: RbsD/FucU domain-containing protein [Bacillota bacterium]|nr:RbsD/FucU domain-containing protein [Bacillota bacterium]
MLMEISSLITPEIYEVIYRMGHLDELVIADANYSALAMSKKVVYSYVPKNHELLAEILKYFPLDEDEQLPVNVMSLDYGFYEEPQIWADYQDVLTGLPDPKPVILNKIPRKEFYERTRSAYATIQTSDPRVMADIIIRKGFVFNEGPVGGL